MQPRQRWTLRMRQQARGLPQHQMEKREKEQPLEKDCHSKHWRQQHVRQCLVQLCCCVRTAESLSCIGDLLAVAALKAAEIMKDGGDDATRNEVQLAGAPLSTTADTARFPSRHPAETSGQKAPLEREALPEGVASLFLAAVQQHTAVGAAAVAFSLRENRIFVQALGPSLRLEDFFCACATAQRIVKRFFKIVTHADLVALDIMFSEWCAAETLMLRRWLRQVQTAGSLTSRGALAIMPAWEAFRRGDRGWEGGDARKKFAAAASLQQRASGRRLRRKRAHADAAEGSTETLSEGDASQLALLGTCNSSAATLQESSSAASDCRFAADRRRLSSSKTGEEEEGVNSTPMAFGARAFVSRLYEFASQPLSASRHASQSLLSQLLQGKAGKTSTARGVVAVRHSPLCWL
ncbi:hypothetical protein cyc_03773 [Cyclospora cayetanensis]|uniref:Uncharacterized protein n=1 Tax=Cyclospora cayetanensis TaxID=88456 RepID=A0A1D3D5K1_9EIME|nr:hypothetical protein cyc_03773 [Cyclospora cayetanensis]